MAGNRVIVTKRGLAWIEEDDPGIPLEQLYPGAKIPPSLQGARFYQTPQGPVVAAPARPPGEAEAPTAEAPVKPVRFPPQARQAQIKADSERFRARLARSYKAVTITARPMRFFGPYKAAVERPDGAAEAARQLLMQHFPEGPGRAAVAQKAAARYQAALEANRQAGRPRSPTMTTLTRRWGMFCHALGTAERAHYEAGLRPARVDPFAIDFSKVRLKSPDRQAARQDRAARRDRDDHER